MKLSKFLVCLFGATAITSAFAANADIDTESVLQEGDGYSLKQIIYTDENGESQSVELFYIHNVEGAENAYIEAGLPPEELFEIQNEVDDSLGGAWGMPGNAIRSTSSTEEAEQFLWIIDKQASLITDQASAEQYIQNKGLESVIEDELKFPTGDIQDVNTVNSRLFGKLRGGCSGWRSKSKSFQKHIDKTFSKSKNFNEGKTQATFSTNMGVEADLNINLGYEYQRKFCIPYKVRYKSLDTQFSYDTNGNVKLKGTIKHSISNKSWKLWEPKVYDSVFFVGPVPVRLAVKLPIEVGTGTITLKASGEVEIDKPLKYSGQFKFKCTRSSCQRVSSSHSNQNTKLLSYAGAGASASVTLKPYINVAAKPILYAEPIFYAKLGAQPSFPIEVFGYYGNTCGDGDGDGRNETVSAALGTLAIEAGITGEVKLFGFSLLKPKYWKLWNKDLLMFDFIKTGSTAFSPILRPTVPDNSLSATLPISIRSCVSSFASRYPINYSVNWGDGTSQYVSAVASKKSIAHTYSFGGRYPITATYKATPKTTVDLTITENLGGAW